MFPTSSLFNQAPNEPPVYTARKPWPPDFSKLTPRHKFALERRYRRRTKLKWARPQLHKAVKLAQWGSAAFVITYGIFWAPWTREDNMFVPIRNWVKEQYESIWTPRPASPPRNTAASSSTASTNRS